MGRTNFLSKPIIEKESIDESNERLIYGASSMQGWRKTQEDAHNAILEYDIGSSFFAIYDGHGCAEVADYCSKKLPEFIKNTPEYKEGKIEDAFISGFLVFDALIKTPEVVETLAAKAKEVKKILIIRKKKERKREDKERKTSGRRKEKEGEEVEGNQNTTLDFVNPIASKDDNVSEQKTQGFDLDNSCEVENEPKKDVRDATLSREEEKKSSGISDDDDENIIFDDRDNEELNSLLKRHRCGWNSGCTAVAALLKGNKLYVANVGDSRCFVCRNGKAIDMSIDHQPMDEAERGRIHKAGGDVGGGRVCGHLNMSRTIGDHRYKENKKLSDREQMIIALPDVRTLTINPNEDEFMVLECDGISNSMSNQEVVDFVRPKINDGRQKLSTICEELFDKLLSPKKLDDAEGMDNMTAVIIKFKSNAKRSVSPDSEVKQVRIKTDREDQTSTN